jgi:hypothetical protein
MADDDERAPITPLVPPELGIDPLLLALIHCAAFLDLASEDLVDPDAAGDVLEGLEAYITRLPADRLTEIQGQLERLEQYAEESGWPHELVEFVADFLYSCGIGEEDEAADGSGEP